MAKMQHRTNLLCAAALAAVAATPTFAQGYYPPAYSSAPPEQVYIYGAHPAPERGFSGANVGTISISRPVRYDDLDLRTAWGAAVLRRRVAVTTDHLCRRLNQFYPTTFYPLRTDSHDCYRRATADAMDQANMAIARARSYVD